MERQNVFRYTVTSLSNTYKYVLLCYEATFPRGTSVIKLV